MTTLLIRQFPDPILKRPTQPVPRVTEPVKQLIEAMVRIMRHHARCVGLAAPQVGSGLRIAVMDSSRNPKTLKSQGLIVLVNPELELLEGRTIQREGCLSIPDFTANVARAQRVRVRAFDRFGSLRSWTFEGFEAVIAQHEVDHLDGRLFLDRVANVTTDVFPRKQYL